MVRNRKSALSPIGIAIAIVCLLAMVMIMSAPMVAEKYSREHSGNTHEEVISNFNQSDLLNRIEDSNRRISQVENSARNIEQNVRNQKSVSSASTLDSNSYICTIEGVVDESGEMIPVSKVKSTTPETKYVFVCGKK